MTIQEDRREYPRARAKWPVTLLTAAGEIVGEIENFSPKGLFISCEGAALLEESFRMVIKIPGRATMNVAGKVMWSEILITGEDEVRLGIGIQFTEISESDLDFLREAMTAYHEE